MNERTELTAMIRESLDRLDVGDGLTDAEKVLARQIEEFLLNSDLGTEEWTDRATVVHGLLDNSLQFKALQQRARALGIPLPDMSEQVAVLFKLREDILAGRLTEEEVQKRGEEIMHLQEEKALKEGVDPEDLRRVREQMQFREFLDQDNVGWPPPNEAED